jgi:Ca-activated chloride channel family protein
MALLWPRSLLLLGLIPPLIAAYVWILRRRRRYAVRYSSLSLVRQALPRHSHLRRHLPFALFLLAVAGLTVALARPVAIVSVPAGRATIILAMDVSRSMCSIDIPPNRLQAAQAAALSFIQRQGPSTQIGIVAFAGFAELILAPSTDQEILEDAVQSLTTGRRTGIGSAILKSIDAIAELDASVAPAVTARTSGVQPTPVPRGAYAPSIIVLLTDGASNTGPQPLDAAQQAVDRGIRVYTIGFGTEQGGIMDCGNALGGQQFGGNPFGGDPFSGSQQFGGSQPPGSGPTRFRRGIDEPTLIEIADQTGGTYYAAESAGELQEVFRSLPTYLITRHETTEISVAFAAIGALLAAVAIVLSLLWHPLP